MILFEKTYASTLEQISNISAKTLEVWSFDDLATRRSMTKAMAERGVVAKFRSTYKPLLSAFLEDIDTKGLLRAHVRYPRHPDAPDARFLLESYPLSALFAGVEFTFTPGDSHSRTPVYECTLSYIDGRQDQVSVYAPNRVHTDYTANQVLSPCGWIIADGQPQALETPYEALFHDTMAAISQANWVQEPYFERLNIAVTLPIADQALPHGDEVLSLSEALHEDFYFSLIEVFQRKSNKPIGARDLQPGQIVPQICMGSTFAVKVELQSLKTAPWPDYRQDLDQASKPLSYGQINHELMQISGETLQAEAVSGQPVFARYHKGQGRSVIISAGQHANETSAPIGCLRAARSLMAKDADFVISPLENPDGYALHQHLIQDNPRHMHHAARYTALGDDLEYRSGARLYEKAIRLAAERACPAQLHINCHGYPAHEWTRPLSGYIPRGFEMWTIPKGFFLILRYRPGFAAAARDLMERVTNSLRDVPGLLAFNDAQIAVFNAHAGDTGFEILNGFPVMISQDDRHTIPLTLITEYPDETVYDGAMIAAHNAQYATVLAAHQALQQLDPSLLSPAVS